MCHEPFAVEAAKGGPIAAERYQRVVAAVAAMQTQEAVRKDAEFKIGVELVRLAYLALTRVLRNLDKTATGSTDDEICWEAAPVQLLSLIPASAWQVLDLAGVPSAVKYTSSGRRAKYRPWLEAVRRALDRAP